MSNSIFAGLAMAAAALTLAGCNKPPEPASAPADAAAAPAPAADAPAPTAPATASGLPADVAALQAQFETCEHFAGEERYDEARAKDIDAGLAANCKPVKAAIPAIEAKYKDDPAVMMVVKDWRELLDAYDG